MHLLLLGGTVFLGRALVEAALARGHRVTLFNRGRHHPELFPEVEKLRGDRDGGLAPLEGRRFDAVIDTSGYVPRIVHAAAALLAPTIGHYTFISSISVYPEYSKIGIDEHEPVGVLDDPTEETITGTSYGPLKALCEQAAEAALPGRVLHVRPGLIVGPHDPTDRFTYWPVRVARGGPFPAPGRPGYLTQFIDVRDLAEWIIHAVEQRITGVYNATGPEQPLALGALFDVCRAVSGSDATPIWIGDEALAAAGVQPWSEVPLYVPETPEYLGFSQVAITRALAAGLRFRPLEQTVADTLAWARTRPADYAWRAGMSPEREAELLRAAG